MACPEVKESCDLCKLLGGSDAVNSGHCLVWREDGQLSSYEGSAFELSSYEGSAFQFLRLQHCLRSCYECEV